MKALFITLVSSLSLIAQAQTAIIAHKSHSGTAVDFFIDPSTNFGIPSPRLVQVIRLNDSTSIEVYDHYRGYYQYDTVYNNPTYANYDLDLDSIAKNSYHRNVEYIHFRKSPKSVKPLPPGNKIRQLNEMQPDPFQVAPKQETPVKKKKNSYLLFLFGITGGGLLAFRILNRIFKPQVIS